MACIMQILEGQKQPCGTPYFTFVQTDDSLFVFTNSDQSGKIWTTKGLFQLLLQGFLDYLVRYWSIVSNVTLRSSRTSKDTFPWSKNNKRSFAIFTSAVSVLWLGLKSDWNHVRDSCASRKLFVAPHLSPKSLIWQEDLK